jgi:class 3 adenylate cyclase
MTTPAVPAIELIDEYRNSAGDHNDEKKSSPDSYNSIDQLHRPTRTDCPEALVRRESRAIWLVKCFAILVVLAATISTGGVILKFTQGIEQDTFCNDFALISEAISRSLLRDASNYFSTAQTVATALTILLEAYNTTPSTFTVPMLQYKRLTNQIVNIPSFATWNPLLRSDEERRQFEAMVDSKEKEGFFHDVVNPTCYACGRNGMLPLTPDVLVAFPGFGQYKCDDLYYAGLVGDLHADACSAVTSRVIDECSCVPSATTEQAVLPRNLSEGIYRYTDNGNYTIQQEPWNGDPYLPMFIDSWMMARRRPMLFNQLSHPSFARTASQMIFARTPQVTQMIDQRDQSFYAKFRPKGNGPSSILFYPVETPSGEEVAGALTLELFWANLLLTPVPRNGKLAIVVVESSCGHVHTYRVKKGGVQMDWIGEGDLHDRRYDYLSHRTAYEDFERIRAASDLTKASSLADDQSCQYRFAVYPSNELESQYITRRPWVYAISAVLIFFFMSLVFVVYDCMVRRRQAKIMAAAKQTDTIVASLFPDSVLDRLLNNQQTTDLTQSPSMRMNSSNGFLLPSASARASVFGSAPIADFFPSCTVMFIDIANFTAWCSEREPSQVFVLLENVYHEFDEIADRLGVFKVETIGDSYVAVAGLPTPRRDHAVVMARFACMCLSKMEQRVKQLEVSLGPSTGDLRARCGLHSGPVTAGVLRGAKARFQLFGDTVNTASRMEASSALSRIHASEQTVSFLNKANKSSWVIPREEKIHLKGKGTLQTFWLDPQRDTIDSVTSGRTSALRSTFDVNQEEVVSGALVERKQRLIEWNVEVLYDLLLRVSASRDAELKVSGKVPLSFGSPKPQGRKPSGMVIDELTNVLNIAPFDAAVQKEIAEDVSLPVEVKEQLRDYVSNIAHLYSDQVPFHNFEHASHVIMSATKLMKRIMSPEGIEWDVGGASAEDRKVEIARQVHNMTYGLSSDLLMQFSVVFSALIHDVDHTGLTNKELIDMNAPVATAYRSKCVAEQNSVDVAWAVLMEDNYMHLRAAIFSTELEEVRFRELIVAAVMATDIADKELGLLRKNRWEHAFTGVCVNAKSDVDRKATIVFEHIIQASDVCHCMQHWHTYQKFNSRLFEERYVAYRKGVAGDNPPWLGWYKGEIWFFDNYIIPLAQKLHDCGVFGVSYHEYLNYAQENRVEWERKGQEVVETLRAAVEKKYQNVTF